MIRFELPVSLTLLSPRADAFNYLQGRFVQGNLEVSYRTMHSAPVEVPDLPESSRYVSLCRSLQIEITESGTSELHDLVAARSWPEVRSRLISVVNRVLRALRNFGFAVHVTELSTEDDSAESQLSTWDLKIVDAVGEETEPLAQANPFAFLLSARRSGPSSEINISRWPDIMEAIEDDRRPGPEHEFVANAIEHARLRNFRYALLEAVIGLEIVVARYLRLSLQRRGFSENRIDNFLSPQLTLRDRIAILLELTGAGDDTRAIDVNRVLEAISWRNKLIHEQGHLPADLSDDVLRDRIRAVVTLVGLVARRHEAMTAGPELQRISDQLNQEYRPAVAGGLGSMGTMRPQLTSVGGRKVNVEFSYIFPDHVPDQAGMERRVARVIELLQARDNRFQPDRHTRSPLCPTA